MVPGLPSNVTEAAGRVAFGRRTGVFRTLRPLPTGLAGLIVVVTVVAAVIAVVAGAVVAGLVLVPAVLLLMAAYRYLLPPAGGRRWLATYEHGFIETTAVQARMARWTDVVGAELSPYPIEEFTLSLNPDPDGVTGEVFGPALPPIQVPLTGLVPRAGLVAVVERQLPGTIPPARREGWQRQARRSGVVVAAFCALMLVPVLALAARPGAGDVAATPQASPTSRPSPTGSYSFYVAGPESTPTDRTTPPDLSTTAAPAPSAGPSVVTNLPRSTFEYGDVCTNTSVFPAAPAYGNPAPHFMYVEMGDLFFTYPPEWESDDPAKVQLVACVAAVTGEQLRTCRYSGDDGQVVTQKLLRTTWDITIRESKTGRQVGRSNFRGGNTQCDPVITVFGGIAETIQRTEPTDKQKQDAIGKYVS